MKYFIYMLLLFCCLCFVLLPHGFVCAAEDVITVTAEDGDDITEKLNKALEDARDQTISSGETATVQVTEGKYKLTDSIHIFSNTTLDVRGVQLTYAGDHRFNLLITGRNEDYEGYDSYYTSDACSGYGAFENITVLGGVWKSTKKNKSSILRLFHATNITLDGVTVTGGGCVHQVEVAAIDGFYVKNCTFKNHGKSETDLTNHEKQEAIQLDIPYSELVYPGSYPDGTPMKNVEIVNNTFKNIARGVGTHTMLCGAYHENIKINDNTFVNVLEECIICLNYVNCEVKNNTITNCGGGILVQNAKEYDGSMNTTTLNGALKKDPVLVTNLNTEISGNTIRLRYHATTLKTVGIFVYGRKLSGSITGGDGFPLPDEDFYISSVYIRNNTIVTAGDGITLSDAKDCEVSGNTINGYNFSDDDSQSKYRDGIRIDHTCENITLTGNTVKNMPRYGIYATDASRVSGIENNMIKNCSSVGICLTNSSVCSYDIAGNTVKNCSGGGLLVDCSSKTANITGNAFAAISGDAAIKLFHNSVAGTISSNRIRDMGKDRDGSICAGIEIGLRSIVKTIQSNRIYASKTDASSGTGILVSAQARVTGAVSANLLSDTTDYAIAVTDQAKVSGRINKNTISNSGKSAISVTQNSSVLQTIENNSIKGSGTNGILLEETSTVKKGITNNTISECKNYGINIQSTENNLTLSYNTIFTEGNSPIYISLNNDCLLTVVNNMLHGSDKQSGIQLLNGRVSISDNDITDFTYGIISSASVSGVICDNIYSNITNDELSIDETEQSSCGGVSNLTCESVSTGKLTITWEKPDHADGYLLEYSIFDDFSGSAVRNLDADSTSYSLYGFSDTQTIYYRVRAYRTIGSLRIYSPYSEGVF